MRAWTRALPIVGLLFAPLLARADLPTSDEAKKVYDFIEHGQGQGIVVVDAKFCGEIQKKSADCSQELKDGIPAGTKVYVWIASLIPKGDTISDVSVQIKEGDKVRETKDIEKLEGKGYLVHAWPGFTAKKAGTWSAVVMRGDKELKTLSIKVAEK